MTLPLPLEMMGAPGSPYTRKMRALLRYRRIPYRMILNFSAEHLRRSQPKVALLPTFYLPGDDGQETAVTDSTPLIRRFDAELPGPRVRPSDPVVALLDSLLEDYADEWLTKCMFHYRWAYPADAQKAASILPLWSRIDMDGETHAKLAAQFSERQIGRLWVVGSNDITAPVIEASYRRFLRLLDARLLEHPFLLGGRPSAGDFACHGQLTCLVGFDPTPAAIALEESPRVCAWVDWMEDLSGLESGHDDWIARDAMPAGLRALLVEIGRVHAPFLVANASAFEAGAEMVEASIDDRPWVQKTFPYQAKCLRWLREEHAALAPADRDDADALLAGTGCEALFV